MAEPEHVQPIQESIPDENLSQTIYTDPLKNQAAVEPDKDQKEFKIQKTIPVLPKDKVIVRFEYDTNDFSKPGFENLKKFAESLVMNPGAMVLISGFTDSGGNNSYNQKLSEFRANIVRSFLLGKGVKPNQIKIKGLGSKNPIESNNTAWGRMMNRRVEIEVLGGE